MSKTFLSDNKDFLRDGKPTDQYPIPQLLIDADYLVNLHLVKMHTLGVTGAMRIINSILLSVFFTTLVYEQIFASKNNEKNTTPNERFFYRIRGNSDRDTLIKVWETPADLLKPECVCYDTGNNVLYVSCINDTMPGDGFISKVSPDGNILNLRWITGINDPKGMSLLNNKLYVSDRNEVIEIDIFDGKILQKYSAPEIKSLNDIAIDDDGTLYISETKLNAVCLLKNGKLELWIQSPLLKGINGMLFENEKLVIGTSNNIYSVDIKKTKTLSLLVERNGFIDGLSPLGDGKYLVSNWRGDIHIVEQGKADKLILTTSSQKINQADFAYIKESNILYSPTFHHNRVIAYRLTRLNIKYSNEN